MADDTNGPGLGSRAGSLGDGRRWVGLPTQATCSGWDPSIVIGALIVFALLLVGLVLGRPGVLREPAGRLLALVALFVLPIFITAEVSSFHLEHAKLTRFCLTCHEMTPFGRSLETEGDLQLAAVHFQNHLVHPERACYACHTDYAMHGDLRAKIRGLRHAWVHYFGSTVEPREIALYEPFDNENCLICHGDATRFEAAIPHSETREALADGTISCLSCHGPAHVIDGDADDQGTASGGGFQDGT